MSAWVTPAPVDSEESVCVRNRSSGIRKERQSGPVPTRATATAADVAEIMKDICLCSSEGEAASTGQQEPTPGGPDEPNVKLEKRCQLEPVLCITSMSQYIQNVQLVEHGVKL